MDHDEAEARVRDEIRPLETSCVKIERVIPAEKFGGQIPSRQIGRGTDMMPRSSVVRADPMTTAKFQVKAFAVGARRSALVEWHQASTLTVTHALFSSMAAQGQGLYSFHLIRYNLY